MAAIVPSTSTRFTDIASVMGGLQMPTPISYLVWTGTGNVNLVDSSNNNSIIYTYTYGSTVYSYPYYNFPYTNGFSLDIIYFSGNNNLTYNLTLASQFSVSFWINVYAGNNYNGYGDTIVNIGNLIFYISPSSGLKYLVFNTNTVTAPFAPYYCFTSYMFVTIVGSNQTAKLYLNTDLIGSLSYTSLTNNITFGNCQYTNIGAFKIYNYSLSSQEINTLYTNKISISMSNYNGLSSTFYTRGVQGINKTNAFLNVGSFAGKSKALLPGSISYF